MYSYALKLFTNTIYHRTVFCLTLGGHYITITFFYSSNLHLIKTISQKSFTVKIARIIKNNQLMYFRINILNIYILLIRAYLKVGKNFTCVYFRLAIT